MPRPDPEISLSREQALRLYQTILRIRRTEERIVEIYPTDKIQSPVHLCIGQEAVSAGVCLALDRTDHLYGTYRSHGIFIAKGGELKKLFAELYAKDTGCARGKGGSMHLVAPEDGLMGCSAVVTSTIPVATGDALASQMQGRKRVVVAFFGDGAVDEGVFFESINFAALKNLPVIFICENNRYAIHSKVSARHKQTEIYRFGEGLGVEGRRFDGNAVDEVYESMRQAVAEVRKGGGPLLLEYLTYRWYEHVGPNLDHYEEYRDRRYLTEAAQRDPLVLARRLLETRYGISEETFQELDAAVRREVEEAVDFAERSPHPEPAQLYEGLF